MPLIDGDFAELLHAVATGRLGEIEPPRLSPQACDDGDRRRARLSGHAGERRRDPRDRGRRAGRGRHRLPRRHRARRRTAWSPRAAGCSPSPRSPTRFANARARAYRAVDQIDFADGFHRRDIGWRELAREKRMNALWTYFWPCFAAGLLIGVVAGVFGFRRAAEAQRRARRSALRRRDRRSRRCGTGRSARPTASPRRSSATPATTLDNYEMTQVTRALASRPAHPAPDPVRPGRRFPAQRAGADS